MEKGEDTKTKWLDFNWLDRTFSLVEVYLPDSYKAQTWSFQELLCFIREEGGLIYSHFMPEINGNGTSGEIQYLSLKGSQ